MTTPYQRTVSGPIVNAMGSIVKNTVKAHLS